MTNETVTDVVRDFDATAAECGGLEAATIHAMTARLSVAHAREVDRAVANDRVRDVHTCHDQCTKTELCRMTRRAEAAEGLLRAWSPIIYEIDRRAEKECCLEDRCDCTVTIDHDDYAAIASGGEDRKA